MKTTIEIGSWVVGLLVILTVGGFMLLSIIVNGTQIG
jgi:hypothetical protein